MHNILVTGGAGYIGSNIAEKLIQQKSNVVVIDNLVKGFRRLLHKKVKFHKIDIHNFREVRRIIKKYNIDSIIHLAALLDVNESEKKPKKYFKNNVLGTENILKVCKNTSVKNFIFSSTAAVYKDGVYKVKENSPTKPKSIYGKAKLKAEKKIIQFLKNSKINYAILRYFNVCGASKSNRYGQINSYDLLFKNLAKAALKKKPIVNIYGNDYKTKDGTCIRDFIHVTDISDIHIKVLKKINFLNKSVLLNCGYGKGLTVMQVVKEFKKVSKKNMKINIESRRKADLGKIVADNRRLRKFIKWKPKYNNLKFMVKSSLMWEKKINN